MFASSHYIYAIRRLFTFIVVGAFCPRILLHVAISIYLWSCMIQMSWSVYCLVFIMRSCCEGGSTESQRWLPPALSYLYVSAIYTPVSKGEIGSECLHLLSCHHTRHTSISAAACFISCTILHYKCNVMCVCIICVLFPSSACLLMYPDLCCEVDCAECVWSWLRWKESKISPQAVWQDVDL